MSTPAAQPPERLRVAAAELDDGNLDAFDSELNGPTVAIDALDRRVGPDPISTRASDTAGARRQIPAAATRSLSTPSFAFCSRRSR